ncbi:GNAT family N-acetyltransferase [Lactiplantibacillus nangangensis]|uniref:GNAT family N-acetyltransferase n=1 Tax=Lactiplantibacillus nangangensis TaxID=2559917 RepID=A0ABW1SGF1_9LACO|nr:GNAT family N-acetyltransferase [Lactiplantibacillus nangangensis]
MIIRNYRPADFAAIRQLFRQTIQTVNAHDYTPAQLTAWIGSDDMATRKCWRASFAAHTTLVAVQADQLVGFADMSATGYLDRLYIHADMQHQGIAHALVTALERAVLVKRYETAASITARPFFERQGYHVIRAQQVERAGIKLTNYLMQKNI